MSASILSFVDILSKNVNDLSFKIKVFLRMVARFFCAFQCAVATLVYGGDPVSLTPALDTLAPSVSNVPSLASGDEHTKVDLKTASKKRRWKKSLPPLVPINPPPREPDTAYASPKGSSFRLDRFLEENGADIVLEDHPMLYQALSLGLPCLSFQNYPWQKEFYACLLGRAFFIPDFLMCMRDIPARVQATLDETQNAFDLLALSKRADPVKDWSTKVLSLSAAHKKRPPVRVPVLPKQVLTPIIQAYEEFLKASQDVLKTCEDKESKEVLDRAVTAHGCLVETLANQSALLSDAQREDFFRSFEVLYIFLERAREAHEKFLDMTPLARREKLYGWTKASWRTSCDNSSKKKDLEPGFFMRSSLYGKQKKIKTILTAMKTNSSMVTRTNSTFYVAKESMPRDEAKRIFSGKQAVEACKTSEIFHQVSLEDTDIPGKTLTCAELKQRVKEALEREITACDRDVNALSKFKSWEETSLYKVFWARLKPFLSPQAAHYLRETLLAHEVLMDTLGAPFGVNLIPVEEILIKKDLRADAMA